MGQVSLAVVPARGTDIRARFIRLVRDGKIRSFTLSDRNRVLHHVSRRVPGAVRWETVDGVLHLRFSRRKDKAEFKLLESLVGRLYDHFADEIGSITVRIE